MTRPGRSGRLIPLLLTGLLLLSGSLLFLRAEPLPGVADTMGYLYAGRQLAAGRGPVYSDPLNAHIAPIFSPYAFQIRITPDERLFLGFPPGLSLLLAAGVLLTGSPAGANFAVPFLAILLLLATYLLARELAGRPLPGLLAAAGLAGTAAFWEFGTAAWSEIPSALLILLGLYGYLRGARAGSRPQALGWHALAALFLVASWFVRYANITIIPALIVYELAHHRLSRLKDPAPWLFTLILLLGLGGLLAFNTLYYGGPTLTSYSPENGWYPFPAFSWAYAFGPSFVGGYSAPAMGRALWENLHLFLFLIPFGLTSFPFSKRLLLVTAVLCTLGPYTFYAFQAEGINSRFILTALPFLSILGGGGALWLAGRLPTSGWRAAWGALLLLLLVRPLPAVWQGLAARNLNQVNGMATIVSFADWSEPEAVFMTYTMNDHIAYYAGRSVLNYRRLLRPDTEGQGYQRELFEPCLAWSAAQVQEQNRPLYFIEDGDPPWGDALNLLGNHFELDLVRENPPTYAVGPLLHPLDETFPAALLSRCPEERP